MSKKTLIIVIVGILSIGFLFYKSVDNNVKLTVYIEDLETRNQALWTAYERLDAECQRMKIKHKIAEAEFRERQQFYDRALKVLYEKRRELEKRNKQLQNAAFLLKLGRSESNE